MSELGTFQKEFVRALFEDTLADDAPGVGIRARGLTVHRNTVISALIDALQANYPTVEQLVGREWFRACAAVYVRENAPATPVLALYGASFPGFLADFPPAAKLLYLGEVARIDRLFTEAHAASDAPCLAAAALARLSPAALFEQRLALHAAARGGRFRHSAVSIWQYHRADARGTELMIDDRSESALITRPHGQIECTPLDLPAYAFLEQIRSGATLGEAGTAALEIDRTADVAGCLARLLASGAFAQLEGTPT
jgi:hypothetical protein